MDTRELDEIMRRYNADNDCSPDYPTVNWTDAQLVAVIQRLVTRVDQLEERITENEHGGYAKYYHGH